MNEQTPQESNGLAVASLILGIIAITGFGPLTGIPAIITGVMGLKNPMNKGLAVAGIIMGIVSIVFLLFIILGFILLFALGAAASDSYSPEDYSEPRDSSSYQQRA